MITGTGLKVELDIKNDVEYLVLNLEHFDRDKAIRSGLSSAANIYKSGGKSRLRQRLMNHAKTSLGHNTGNLMNSFKTRVYKAYPGALVGFYRGIGGGNHAHLVDRGTKRRRHPLTGTSGIMPANSFWTDTHDQDSNKAVDRLMAGVERAVNRINNRQ